jgi:hypothetical protein
MEKSREISFDAFTRDEFASMESKKGSLATPPDTGSRYLPVVHIVGTIDGHCRKTAGESNSNSTENSLNRDSNINLEQYPPYPQAIALADLIWNRQAYAAVLRATSSQVFQTRNEDDFDLLIP